MIHKRKTTYLLFFTIFLMGIFAKILFLLCNKGCGFDILFFSKSHFIDFYQHIERFNYGKNIYLTDQDACFPAFAYLFYYVLYRLFGFELNSSNNIIQNTDIFGYIIAMYVGMFLAIFVIVAKNYLKNSNGIYSDILIILLCLSYPFSLSIERGNISVYVMLLILLAICLDCSDKVAFKELSLILIAIASSIKIYPAIYGLVYIKQKRYREAIRLVIYGIVFFFLPFIFFGGFDGFKHFITNITTVGTRITNISITGIVNRIIGGDYGIAIGKIISIIYLIIVLCIVLLSKLDWKSMGLLSSLMLIFISESGSYCLIYWTIPLLMFCKYNEGKRIDYFHAVLFALIFGCIPIKALGCSGIYYIMLYIQLFILLFEKFYEIVLIRKSKV